MGATDKRTTKDNVLWQINLLEAKRGGETQIKKATSVARKLTRKAAKHVPATRQEMIEKQESEEGKDEPALLEKQIRALWVEKCSRKVFALKKDLRKAVRKAATQESQKITKRLNAIKGGAQTKEQITLQAKLDELKSLDVEEESSIQLNNVLRVHESLSKNEIVMEVLEKEEEGRKSRVPKTIALSSAMDEALSSLSKTITLLTDGEARKAEVLARHRKRKIEEVSGDYPVAARPTRNVKPTKAQAKAGMAMQEEADPIVPNQAVSLFMDSLGPATTAKAKKTKTKKGKKGKKQATESDEDDYFSQSDYDNEDLVEEGGHEDANFEKYYKGNKGKKNRLGQRARQKKFEEEFGKEANHIRTQEVSKAVKLMSKRGGRTEKPLKEKSKPSAKDLEGLHPSWQAKKLATTNPAFQGTKVSFGKDEEVASASPASTPVPARAIKPVKTVTTTKTVVKETTKEETSNMHPSWAAKRMQTPALSISTTASASGKNKIVFDNE